jgi:hypothetical protein
MAKSSLDVFGILILNQLLFWEITETDLCLFGYSVLIVRNGKQSATYISISSSVLRNPIQIP